jgi:branched-chain amino acid transport system permease protein
LLSFAIGAAYAGIAGGLLCIAWCSSSTRHLFTVGASIMMYLMVVVAGPGYFWGRLLGARRSGVVLPEWLRFAQAWYLFVFGSAVVLLMIWLPDGLLEPARPSARQPPIATGLRHARSSALSTGEAQP